MARIGGRNVWIAVPAGLLCLAVVAGLVWFGGPMVPVAVRWAGDTLRGASAPKPAPTAEVLPAARAAEGAVDCRSLYADDQWRDLVWFDAARLSQTSSAPATSVTALTDALAPQVRVTCAWRLGSGETVVTTIATVGADAQGAADTMLREQGFACDTSADAVSCRRSDGDVVEDQVVRGGIWLSTIETNWHPEEYSSRLVAHVWG